MGAGRGARLEDAMAGTETLICRSCGVEDGPELEWQTFSNKTLHLKASCRSCGRYIQYVPQNWKWLRAATSA